MASERGVFAEEYRVWHTPAIGAYLFWRFATIFVQKSRGGQLPSCIHFFLLAGMLRDVRIVTKYIFRRLSLLTVVKAIKENGDMNVTVSPDDILREDETLLVLGEHKAIRECFHL